MYATVDTGSTYTCLPADLLRDLGIVPCRRIRSELADGSIVEDDLGIVHVRVEGVYIPTPAIFANGGAPALLGAYTLEGALLVVDPVRQRLAPTHALRYGIRAMQGRNFRMDRTISNETIRIQQKFADYLKPENYQKCLVRGCQSTDYARGHLIPRSVLKRLAYNGHVLLFAAEDHSLYRKLGAIPRSNVPISVGYKKGTTGYFTCKEHEKLFWEIERKGPDFNNERHLILLAYKAALHTTWNLSLLKNAHGCMFKEIPNYAMHHYLAVGYGETLATMLEYKNAIENCLQPESCKVCKNSGCRLIKHRVKFVKSKPAIAVSQWLCSPKERFIKETDNDYLISPIANRGMTVQPVEGGHMVASHYLSEESELVREFTKSIFSASGNPLKRNLSAYLLKHYQYIAISPSAWKQFTPKKQSAIKQYWLDTFPTPDVGLMGVTDYKTHQEHERRMKLPPPNPNEINLLAQ